MRSANVVLPLVALFMGMVLWGQAKETKETFKTRIGIPEGEALREVEGTFTVSERGYSWTSTDEGLRRWSSEDLKTRGRDTLIPWKDVRRWNCSKELYSGDASSSPVVWVYRPTRSHIKGSAVDYTFLFQQPRLFSPTGATIFRNVLPEMW